MVSDDGGLSLSFPGRHPGSSLPALRVYGKNRPTCPTPPAAVYTLGSHGYPRDKNHPATDGVWAGGCTGVIMASLSEAWAVFYLLPPCCDQE